MTEPSIYHRVSKGLPFMNLFHVVSSPRKERSASIEVANAFIGAWLRKNPSGVVETLNVWDAQLPDFDGEALAAKYAGLEGKQLTPEQDKAWSKIKNLANLFLRADLILFSVPMWNFGIPYKLKHLIDTVSHKDILFTFDERGLLGLLGGKTVVVVAARGAQLGGDFPEREPAEPPKPRSALRANQQSRARNQTAARRHRRYHWS